MPIRRGARKTKRSGAKRSIGRKRSKFTKRVARIAKGVVFKIAETQASTQRLPAITLRHNRTAINWAEPATFSFLRTTQGTQNPSLNPNLPNPPLLTTSSGNRVGDEVMGLGIDLRYTIEWSGATPNAYVKIFQINYSEDGTYPTEATFYSNINENQLNDYINKDKWSVERTWTHRAPTVNSRWQTTGVNQTTLATTINRKWIPWKTRVQYQGDNAATPNRQPLFMVAAYSQQSDGAINIGTINGSTRFYYKDNN